MSQSSDTDPGGTPPGGSGQVLLGRFLIESTLGQGGMGEVLLARDQLLGRRVALKRLRPDEEGSAGRRAAILREARRASRISDPHVAAIYDVIEIDGDVLLVMEFIEGVTLRARMADPLPMDAFWDIATQCAEGVAAAHAHGVVHRDLKPENLMISRGGLVKILDFGIAKRSGRFTTSSSTFTSADAPGFAGTPEYMAPEAHLGTGVDERTDLFSLGVVFYELLTGQQPFAGATYPAVLNHVLHTVPPPVHEANPEAGPTLSALIATLMAKDPAERPASAGDLLARLRLARAAGAEPLSAKAPASRPRVQRPRLPSRAAWVLPLAAAMPIVAVGGTLWVRGRGAALPAERNVAVLQPAPASGARSPDAESFALGFAEIMSGTLQRHVSLAGFQMASFKEGFDEGVRTPAEAREVLGANLALVPALDQEPGLLRVRFELFDTVTGKRLRVREVRGPASEPFAFIERARAEATAMLGLASSDSGAGLGLRGAGTLRFCFQGIGRLRAAEDTVAALGAIADFETACRTEPESAVARAWLAAARLKIYLLTRETTWLERAEATALEARRIDANRAEPHRVLGMVYAAMQRNDDALVAFERAFVLDPSDDDVAYRRGRLYGRLGDKARERAVFEEVARLRPHAWQPHWWLGAWHFREGQITDAIAAYDRMVERAPLLHKGHASLGGALILDGQYARAIETLRRSVALRPTRVAFDNLGTAYFNARRADEAISAYNQSFQFGFADYESWLNLGDAYHWLKGREDLALEAYAQSAQLGRQEIVDRSQRGGSVDPLIPAHLATIFPKLGHADSAHVYLDRALRGEDGNPMVDYCAALTWWQLGDRERALEWLERSVAAGYPVIWLRDSPIFDEWRSAPRFAALVAEGRRDPNVAGTRRKGE
jgi:serine/threonine-protein kinase